MRSTTPPLYYRRPEGVAAPYYISACSRVNAAATACARVSSAERTAHLTPSFPPTSAQVSVPSVTNPFAPGNAPPQLPATAENSADLLRLSATRWSTSAVYGVQALEALEAEEAALALEEQAARAKLAELQLTRQRQSEEQLELSHGWATLLDREERYFTEPFVDLSEEIMAREHQCALLQDQWQQAKAHLESLCHKHQQYDAVVEEKNSLEEELRRVRETFMAIEERRKACRLRAERLFDAESKRSVEAARLVRELDVQLKDMTSSGPLAEVQSAPASCPPSRGVTFAQKSIILDEGEEGECAGITQGLSGSSVCLQDGDNDEEDDVGGISGPSARYSLGILKRRRMELSSA